MVILFKGTDKSKNFSPQALALSAGISATKYYKKTLVMQLTTKYPIENYLIGKKIKERNIGDNAYLFEDTGIDSLIRRVGVAQFRHEHFANAVTPVTNSENLLDILNVSSQTEDDLIREIEKNPTIIGTIVKAASKIYDNIFILVNGKNHNLIKGIISYIDKTVTCIPQSVKEDIIADSTENNCYLITNFDYKSSYGVRQMEKIYGGKMFTMPYNVDFKDYYTNNNMLQYILHNISPEPGDYSFHLISEMTKLTGYLIDEEEYEDKSFKFSIRTLERILDPETPFAGFNVEINDVPGGFFKKGYTDIHINNNRRKGHGRDEEDFEEADLGGEDDDFEEEQPKKKKKFKKEKAPKELEVVDLEQEDDEVNYDEPADDDYSDDEAIYSNQPAEEELSDEDFIEEKPKKKKIGLFGKKEKTEPKSIKEQIDEFANEDGYGDEGEDNDFEQPLAPAPAPKVIKKTFKPIKMNDDNEELKRRQYEAGELDSSEDELPPAPADDELDADFDEVKLIPTDRKKKGRR